MAMRWLFGSVIVWLHGAVAVQAARPSDFPHPRLLFPASAEVQVREKIAADPLAAQLQKNILHRAEAVLTSRTCRFEKIDGRRLLAESRLALHHIVHCAWAWRTTGEKRFFDRTVAEMEAACAMPHWNPDHFLDTAEMSAAMAIGYDWLYRDLTAAQRVKFANELDRKGLQTLLEHPHPWWNNATNNWAQVCGTGMEFAAIALDAVQPERSEKVRAQSKILLEKCVKFYLPDGAYPEGPGYWHYGSSYQVLHMAANASLYGAMKTPEIWRKTGEFMVHLQGPSGMVFNFADGGMGKSQPTSAQTWIAAQFPESSLRPLCRAAVSSYLQTEDAMSINRGDRFQPLHLLWLPAETNHQGVLSSLSARFGGEQEMAVARTSWGKDAAWLAIKGGTGAVSHGHLDAGSFVYDAAGVRWFFDLGKDSYSLPGYFGNKRWNYLRLNNRSHNTLVIGDALQCDPEVGCPVTSWKENGSQSRCEINLTSAYTGQCAEAKRSVMFDRSNGRVELQDVIREARGVVRWAVVTDAAVKIEKRQVILTKEGKSLILRRDDDGAGAWQEFSLKPSTAEEESNEGYRMIGFLTPRAETLEFRVSWHLLPSTP